MKLSLLNLYCGIVLLVLAVSGEENNSSNVLPYLFEKELENILQHPINVTEDSVKKDEQGVKVVFVYVTQTTKTLTAATETVVTTVIPTEADGTTTYTTITTTNTFFVEGNAATTDEGVNTEEGSSSESISEGESNAVSDENANEESGENDDSDGNSESNDDSSPAEAEKTDTTVKFQPGVITTEFADASTKTSSFLASFNPEEPANTFGSTDKVIGNEDAEPYEDAIYTYTDPEVQDYDIGIDTSDHGPTFIADQNRHEAYSTSTSNPVTESIPLPDSLGPTANFDLIDKIVPTTTYFLYIANFTTDYKYPTTTGNSSTRTQRNPLATGGLKVPLNLGSAYIKPETLTRGIEIMNLGDGKTSKIFIDEPSTSAAPSSSFGKYLNSTVSSVASEAYAYESDTLFESDSIHYESDSTTSGYQTSALESDEPEEDDDDEFHNFDIDEYNLLHPDDNLTEPRLEKRAANGFTGDLFQPISTSDVSSKFPRKLLPLSIPSGVSNSFKYQTNKFYVNLFLGTQTNMIWSYPFGLQWTKSSYYGFAVQHTIVSKRVFGTTTNSKTPSYYFNPIDIKEMIISATSFTSSKNKLNVSNMKVMTANVKLSTDGSVSTNYIEIPVVQGMGMVTSIYHGNLVPRINSAVGFKTFVSETSTNLNSNVIKYRATLFSGVQYLIYVTLPSGTSKNSFKLLAKDSYTLNGSKAINGLIIQLAVAPSTKSQDMYYDSAAGKYVIEGKLKAKVTGGKSAEYRFSYNTKGSSKSGKPIVFAYQHHFESFDAATKKGLTGVKIPSTTKGDMYGYLETELVINENFNLNVQMLPWTQLLGSKSLKYTSNQLQIMAKVANTELSVNIATLVNSANSNYYSGKILDKYAYIMFVVCDIVGDKTLCKSALSQMKKAFEIFTSNKQYYPLIYDTKFGGITPNGALQGDVNADFGSSYYNDHHFHYGYFVHAAAIVGYIDKKVGDGKWVLNNKWWVDALVRDVANPSPDDKYFPIFRMFDFFAGHSWASGLFAGGDGRNQESTSEDYNFSYGMKLWGKVSGNKRMENVGDLMLAVMKKAMNKYYLYSSTNKLQPSNFIGNKVAGILFDNKIDYTTYFGSNMEYIHGIHMLPVTPASSIIRGPTFVKEEWNAKIAGSINSITSGWAGILRLNQVLFDPSNSYSFFSSKSFKSSYLDNGLSRTWALAFGSGVKNVVG